MRLLSKITPAVFLLLAGCASIADYHADSKRTTVCTVTDARQLEAHDLRTGFPLFSTPHREVCYLNTQNQVVWITETSTEASLQAFSDIPSSIIQNATPKATVGY